MSSYQDFKIVRTIAVIFLVVFLFAGIKPLQAEICGDANGDGSISIFDITFLVSHLYKGGPAPADPAQADVDGSGEINIFDISYLISYLYLGGPAPVNCGYVHIEIQEGCLDYDLEGDDADTAYFQVLGNDLYIYHINAWYNCGLAYVVDYYFNGANITAVESDTGEPADCYCHFNLKSILYDLDDGEYFVVLIGIEGDTVGTGVIIVDENFGLIGYQDSGCLDKGKDASAAGTIVYSYNGDTLSMLHNDAYFNCGTIFLIEFEQAGDTLRFFELNIGLELEWCMCYFDVWAYVLGVGPGEYVAEVYEQQYDWDEIRLVDRQILLLGE